ncbi:MAG: CsbD family protein [Methylotenera sp.]|nr:CsbD family protein [Methylotenera sp.]MDI1309858.1 CsbD family protein [Methylotenera sp.]
MNKDTLQGDWKQLTGKIKQKWGKLTDDDMTQAEGNREYLVGKLQEHYGLTKDMAKQNLKDIGYGD